jgi:hypothetical protein
MTIREPTQKRERDTVILGQGLHTPTPTLNAFI